MTLPFLLGVYLGGGCVVGGLVFWLESALGSSVSAVKAALFVGLLWPLIVAYVAIESLATFIGKL